MKFTKTEIRNTTFSVSYSTIQKWFRFILYVLLRRKWAERTCTFTINIFNTFLFRHIWTDFGLQITWFFLLFIDPKKKRSVFFWFKYVVFRGKWRRFFVFVLVEFLKFQVILKFNDENICGVHITIVVEWLKKGVFWWYIGLQMRQFYVSSIMSVKCGKLIYFNY